MDDALISVFIVVVFAAWVIVPSFFIIRWAIREDKKKKLEREEKQKANLAEAASRGLHIDMAAYDAAQQPRPMGDSEPKLVCPRCGCSQLYAGKKGFSAGKAITGAFIAGPVGLVGGAIGQNKVIVTCLSCGHKWKV